jgi:hypothetical protein
MVFLTMADVFIDSAEPYADSRFLLAGKKDCRRRRGHGNSLVDTSRGPVGNEKATRALIFRRWIESG